MTNNEEHELSKARAKRAHETAKETFEQRDQEAIAVRKKWQEDHRVWYNVPYGYIEK